MKKFEGTWIDRANDTITIKTDGNLVEGAFSNGRKGPFKGFYIDLASPVINKNFHDYIPSTGVMSDDGNEIYWSNNSKWTRVQV